MKFRVEMLAFLGPGNYRIVEVDPVPRVRGELLEAIFRNGQNDHCPMEAPSVSAGDVIRIPDQICKGTGRVCTYYEVAMIGFTELDRDDLEIRRAQSRRRLRSVRRRGGIDPSVIREQLADFGLRVLSILQSDTDWGGDTLDSIMEAAFSRELAEATGDRALFTARESIRRLFPDEEWVDHD